MRTSSRYFLLDGVSDLDPDELALLELVVDHQLLVPHRGQVVLQGHQLNIAVCIWYLLKSDLSRVRGTVAFIGKAPEKHGYVYLVVL